MNDLFDNFERIEKNDPEFHEIFELLKNDWGLPNSFSEYDGYVWNQEGCIITVGLVRLKS